MVVAAYPCWVNNSKAARVSRLLLTSVISGGTIHATPLVRSLVNATGRCPVDADDEGQVEALIVRPGGGSAVPLLGMWHKVAAGHLDGRLLVMEGEIQPGQFILPHTHT